jgi:predicted peptidase
MRHGTAIALFCLTATACAPMHDTPALPHQAAASSAAQEVRRVSETGFLNRTAAAGAVTIPYVVYVPSDYEVLRARGTLPVILFLHGAGERGAEGTRQTVIGLGSAIRWNPTRFPALIIFPQAPADSRWMGEVGDAAMAALDRTIKEFGGDRRRVYLTGLSLGGYGTWHFAMAYPDRFAAIVPVCGGIVKPESAVNVRQSPLTLGAADPYALTAGRVRNLPVWIFHGADDPIIPASESRRMHEELKKLGADVRYTEYPGVGHDSWDRAYGEEELWRWLLAQ